MIIVGLSILCIFEFVMGIILLTYIEQSQSSFHDWRRIILIFYSYLIVAITVGLLINIGKRSSLLIVLAPTLPFLFFTLPLIIAIMINIYFFRKNNENLSISRSARNYLIAFQYTHLVLIVCIMALILSLPIYIEELIKEIDDITSIFPIFTKQVKKESTTMTKQLSSRIPQALNKIWNPLNPQAKEIKKTAIKDDNPKSPLIPVASSIV